MDIFFPVDIFLTPGYFDRAGLLHYHHATARGLVPDLFSTLHYQLFHHIPSPIWFIIQLSVFLRLVGIKNPRFAVVKGRQVCHIPRM